MRIAHHRQALATLRRPSEADPLRVLVSGCLAGLGCGVDGTDYGMGNTCQHLLSLSTVKAFPFCPEDHGMGTPRTMPDLHGGDGFAVLEGNARVKDEHGTDLTEPMLVGARAMVAHARLHSVELALLTDMSAACGSQVISLGCRLDANRRFQKGVGVATAMLLGAGVPVVSQRDFASLAELRALLDPGFIPEPGLLDHHDHPWVVEHFGADRRTRRA